MDKIGILNDALNANPGDVPFVTFEQNGTLRVLGRTYQGTTPFFFDRTYSRKSTTYTKATEELLFHPTAVTDAILEALGLHNYLYFGSWREQVAQTREFFDRLRQLKKQGAKELK